MDIGGTEFRWFHSRFSFPSNKEWERQQAEVALQQAEAKYRSIFENTAEGIFQTTVDGRYISANPALSRMYGYESPEELIANLCNIEQQLYVCAESSC